MKKLLFLAFLFLLFIRYITTLPSYKNGDRIKITTRVVGEPVRYETSQYIKVLGLSFYLPLFPEITYGDKIAVTGEVNGKKLKNAKLEKLQKESGGLYAIRQRIISFFKSSLPEPSASLVAGSVLGSKNMPPGFWEDLKATGTAHVVVASGTNVTFVAGFLMSVATLFTKRKRAILIVIAGIAVYVILSGFDAPIIRSAIMGIVAFSAQLSGRVVNSLRALAISVYIMLFISPSYIYDLGFILSVLATFGMILLNTKITKLFKFLPNIVREGFSSSLSAQVFVAPVIFATFGQFNIASPIINALILWTIPPIMIIGAVASLVSFLSPKLGGIILYLCYPMTWWFTNLVSVF